MDFALQLSGFILTSIGLILLYTQIRATRLLALAHQSAILASLGSIQGEIAASTSLRARTTIPEPRRDKLQVLRVIRPIPDPSARRVVDVTRDSVVPPSQGVLVEVEVRDER